MSMFLSKEELKTFLNTCKEVLVLLQTVCERTFDVKKYFHLFNINVFFTSKQNSYCTVRCFIIFKGWLFFSWLMNAKSSRVFLLYSSSSKTFYAVLKILNLTWKFWSQYVFVCLYPTYVKKQSYTPSQSKELCLNCLLDIY